MEREFLTLFGFTPDEIEPLINAVTRELKQAIQEENTINGIKTACLRRVLAGMGESSPEHYATAGVMVEQAYNAALAASKNQKNRKQ